MALTRKLLKGMGLTDEQVDTIIEAHTETTNALKDERDTYKEAAEKLPGVQQELETAKEAAKDSGKDAYKVKYDALKEEFESYKNDITAKETKTAKERAYRELLKAAGVSEKRIDAVVKVSDLDSIELDDKGIIKNSEKLSENVKSEWSDFIEQVQTKGADTSNPPSNNGKSTMTKDQIVAIADRNERRAAIAQNINLFK